MNSDGGAKIKIGGIKFPVALLDALRDSRLVVFAGAGVSMGEPACLPSFGKLADMIAEGTGEIRGKNESPERFLGQLAYGEVDVPAIAADILSGGRYTSLHENLLRLYQKAGFVKLVTTNFDTLFEKAAEAVFGKPIDSFDPYSLPRGSDFNGVVHIHGYVNRRDDMILTDSDFGVAYMTRGWARRFFIDLCINSNLLFVGYSHSDTIVNYLNLALSDSMEQRKHKHFGLILSSDDPKRWQRLGIQPIAYDERDDHQALHESVRKLADFVNRSNSDWKSEIKRLVSNSPKDMDDQEESHLKYALNDDEKVRFFTRSIASPDWLDWLDERDYLNDLFMENEWNRYAGLWAGWLAEKFAVAHADRLQHVIGRREGRLPDYFWTALANAVQSEDLNDEAFGQWMTLLLSRVSEDSDLGLELKILAEYCIQRNLMQPAFRIFEIMLTANFDPATRKFKLVYEYNPSCMLWVNILRHQLDQCAEHTLGRLIQRLEDRHETLSRWKSASLHHDQSLWIMGLIANLEPVNNIYRFDSLTLYAARDCLDWLIKERREDGVYWQRRLTKSESPLLRSLAVHSIRMDESMSPEQKAAWLLETNPLLEVKRINDWAPHQDLYKLAEQIYPCLNDERRRAMIEVIEQYRILR